VLMEEAANESWPLSEDWFRLRSLEAACLWRRQKVTEAISRLDALRTDLLRLPDTIATCQCALELAAAHSLAGDRQVAKSYAMEALVSARRCRSPYFEALAQLNLSMLEKQSCRWRAAADAVEVASRAFEQQANQRFLALCQRQQAIVAWKRGEAE